LNILSCNLDTININGGNISTSDPVSYGKSLVKSAENEIDEMKRRTNVATPYRD